MKTQITGTVDYRFNEMDRVLGKFVEHTKLPCIVALVLENEEIVYRAKFGYKDIQTKNPIQYDSIFRIASMSKPIISVAALMLYEQGKFNLNDPLSAYIPQAKDLKVYTKRSNGNIETVESTREVTIMNIFTHTGGFIYGWSDPTHPVDAEYIKWNENLLNKDLSTAIPQLMKIPLKHQPGTKWFYSRSTDILGYLVEIFSGQPLDQFLKSKIFSRLHMEDTDFYVPIEKLHRLVSLATRTREGMLINDNSINQGIGRFKPAFLSGGGGLVSTIDDYLQFCQMLLNRGQFNNIRFLKEETVDLMTQDHTNSMEISYVGINPNEYPAWANLPEVEKDNMRIYFKDSGFGLGLQVKIVDDIIPSGIHGWNGAYTTDYWVDPKKNVIGIILSQLYPPFTTSIYTDFRRKTYEALN